MTPRGIQFLLKKRPTQDLPIIFVILSKKIKKYLFISYRDYEHPSLLDSILMNVTSTPVLYPCILGVRRENYQAYESERLTIGTTP